MRSDLHACPKLIAFESVMESEAGAEAMRYDGVHRDALVVYVET